MTHSFNGLMRGCFTAALLICISSLPATGQTKATDQTTATVRGEVLDAGSGTPLPGANIVLTNSTPLLGTTTDEDGRFILNRIPLGRQSFTISYLGYTTKTVDDVLVTSGREQFLTVRLIEEVIFGDGVQITAETPSDVPLNAMAVVSAAQFTTEKARRFAGGLDDPARMVSAYAGVASSSGVENNAIVVRGNAPKGVQWRLEGVEIPNPSHFAGLNVQGGGAVTLFSAYVLDDGDFLTGAFPAEYGNVLAGVFDMSFRSGNSDKREHALQFGLLGVEGASEGPFIKGGRGTYLFNYRYSTLGLLMPILPTEDLATYQDLSFKLDFPTRNIGRFEIWGLGGLDRQRASATEDSTDWEYEVWDREDSELNLANGSAGLSHTLLTGSLGYLETTLAASSNRTKLSQRRLDDDLVLRDDVDIDNADNRLTGKVVYNAQPSSRFGLRMGVSYKVLHYRMNLSSRVGPGNEGPVQEIVDDINSAGIADGFAQASWHVSPSVTFGGGLHLINFSVNGQSIVEPRASLLYRLTRNTDLSLGYGRHSQIEDLRIYLTETPDNLNPKANKDLRLAQADHVVAGLSQRVNQKTRVRLEAFYQNLSSVPVIPDSSFSMINFEQDFSFQEALVNEGKGRNYGTDFTLERSLADGYYYLVTGSLFRSEFRNPGMAWTPTLFDRRYLLSVLAGKEWVFNNGNVFGFSGRSTVMGGQRQSPVDQNASRLAEEVVFDESTPYTDKQRPYIGVDLTLTWQRNHRRFSEAIALQVKNAFLAKDRYFDYNYKSNSVEEIREGFPLPVLSYRIEF